MERKTITAGFIKTIAWLNDTIVDWANAGEQYTLDGKKQRLAHYTYAFSFDASITSSDGQYAFIYQKLGTKGLLLKNGELLREINRSYYCANVYEYPAAFATVNGTTYLIHCPIEYCRLDFENVETGEVISNISVRDPGDFFHSRLEVSFNCSYLLSKGWHWHPLGAIYLYNIKDCIENPLLLDKLTTFPNVDIEIGTASFINDTKIVMGSADESYDEENMVFPPKHIAVWDINTNKVSTPVKVNAEFGNLFAINEDLAWDTFAFPKIINIHTGDVVDKDESINSGKQNSSIVSKSELAQVVFNQQTKQLAIMGRETIEVLTPDKSEI